MTDPTRTIPPDDSERPHLPRIGDFVLRRVIASGGMGTVYEAIQEHPKRVVAIKLMKRGVTSTSALRRFEFESQLLARLHHPGIAEVYEAGTHTDGAEQVPYFAMEYVPNARAITTHAEGKSLDIRERLRIFALVCDAVQHGHQKGIVHRDLKPDNIIVGPAGQPKVIDFGVARATDSDLALATQQTQIGQLIGTLQYMSPEQVDADPHDIDIRADVYSLGVILYELLSGKLPYDVRDVPALEAARRIREESPTRLGSVERGLAGDIETIVHKALEKDRDRRYQSAGELAADVRRFLDHQPITARPPTITYQMKVFARRNRALVGAAAVVFAVLIAAIVTSTSLYLRAEHQRVEAERQAERALSAVGFVNDMVMCVNPMAAGQEVKIGDLLDGYSARLTEAFPDDPAIEAKIRTSFAEAYNFLDLFENRGRGGRYHQAAQSHYEAAIDLCRRVHGGEAEETLEAMEILAGFLQKRGKLSDAEGLYREILAIDREKLGERDPQTLASQRSLAGILQARGQLDEAEEMVRFVIDELRESVGEDSVPTIGARLHLVGVLKARGDLAQAESIAVDVFADYRRILGEESRLTDSARRTLAGILLARGKEDDARSLYGARLPGDWGAKEWIQARAGPLDDAAPTLIVFWEPWCPYSTREMPRLEEWSRAFNEDGLRVVGLTRLSRSATREKAVAFLDEAHVSFPIAEVNGDLRSYLGEGGVPFAVVARDATVLWTGHPAQLFPGVFEGMLARN